MSTKNIGKFLANNAVMLLMVAVAIGVGIARPAFFSGSNFRNLMSNTAIRLLVALGVSGCLITTGTYLSAGRSVGLYACIAANFLPRGDDGSTVYSNL